jgi:hypothetical protein
VDRILQLRKIKEFSTVDLCIKLQGKKSIVDLELLDTWELYFRELQFQVGWNRSSPFAVFLIWMCRSHCVGYADVISFENDWEMSLYDELEFLIMIMFLFDPWNLGRIRINWLQIWIVHGKSFRMMYRLLISGKFHVELRRRWPEKTTGATAPAAGSF